MNKIIDLLCIYLPNYNGPQCSSKASKNKVFSSIGLRRSHTFKQLCIWISETFLKLLIQKWISDVNSGETCYILNCNNNSLYIFFYCCCNECKECFYHDTNHLLQSFPALNFFKRDNLPQCLGHIYLDPAKRGHCANEKWRVTFQ